MNLFQVDAFTDAAFSGNPAAVCFLEGNEPDALLQAIAAEMNLSETAFVNFGEEEIGLRWFTPLVEVDLCGHATLASSVAIWRSGRRTGPLRFSTRSGTLGALPYGCGAELDFPAHPSQQIDLPSGLVSALGAVPRSVHTERGNWLVELENPETVVGLDPDFQAVAALPVRGIIVTAAGGPDGYDFVSRYFAPSVGIDEDPVTGAAHCALAPFWAARLGRDELVGRQLSLRGGRVEVAVQGDRVRLRGEAVVIFEGDLYPAGEVLSSASVPGS